MSCPHTYLTRPHTIIATFATHAFLFAPQAWAAPHSINLVRRDSSSSASKIAVRRHSIYLPSLASSLNGPYPLHPLGSHHSCTRFPRRYPYGVLQE